MRENLEYKEDMEELQEVLNMTEAEAAKMADVEAIEAADVEVIDTAGTDVMEKADAEVDMPRKEKPPAYKSSEKASKIIIGVMIVCVAVAALLNWLGLM